MGEYYRVKYNSSTYTWINSNIINASRWVLNYKVLICAAIMSYSTRFIVRNYNIEML